MVFVCFCVLGTMQIDETKKLFTVFFWFYFATCAVSRRCLFGTIARTRSVTHDTLVSELYTLTSDKLERDDDRTLAQAKIERDSTLHLRIRAHAGPPPDRPKVQWCYSDVLACAKWYGQTQSLSQSSCVTGSRDVQPAGALV